ncbi:uncharacterized protein LOC133724869 isoform X1 [Rosa rugosa]|uniref:uncharacterized protein LOC133724869 isoform X1 n=1 Tax=Rosa rugosa TaxID=74645 RepID=UPI002B4055F5|nr:uncharacterized protein LOC133724869 isoform X1 [Rosa rugosa]
MITMDVKGINWVGCVYEKFESMCLEVEENMYQDTVKFVEDQVQTVGESVKKLYADIMQDLLCDSSLDGENISACGFPIEHYSDVDNSKKSKIRKTKEHVKVGVEEVNGDSEVISLVEKDVEHTGLFHRQRMYDSCTRSSGDCAKVACSDLYSRQDHGMRSYNKKNLVVKQTPIKDRLPGANTAVGKDFNRVSLSCSEFSNENRDASCDQPDEVITPTAEGMRCDSMRESCVVANASQCSDDVSINCQSSDLIVFDKSDGKRWNELLESSIGGLSAESNGGSNDSSVHAIDSNIGVHGTEISQQSDKAKLEETCVMVSGEELHFVHHVVANCKPYKKKIPKAFTSRTSSARKQEYEQLALWHGHHTKSFLGGEDSKKSPTRDFCESEWEIL